MKLSKTEVEALAEVLQPQVGDSKELLKLINRIRGEAGLPCFKIDQFCQRSF